MKAPPVALGLAGVVVVATALFAVLALGRGPEPGPEPISVQEALLVQARDDASQMAVTGWFQGPPPMFCPYVPEDVSPLERSCSNGVGWLMATPERIYHARAMADGSRQETFAGPVGPAFHVFLEVGVDIPWVIPLPQEGDSTPTPVIFVGHFDDPRSATCRDRKRCLDLFVVEAARRG